MSNRTVLSSLLVCISVAFGAACAPAELPPHPEKAAVKVASKVFTAPASAETKAKLGITRWHMIFQDGGKIVIDGANANGQVKFSSLLVHDGKTFTVESYAQRGSLVIESKTRALRMHTLPEGWSTHASSFSADWAQFHAQSAYSLLGDISTGLGIASNVATIVGGVAKGVAAIAGIIPGGQGVAVGAAAVAGVADATARVLGVASTLTELADKAMQTISPKPAEPTAPVPANPDAPPATPADPNPVPDPTPTAPAAPTPTPSNPDAPPGTPADPNSVPDPTPTTPAAPAPTNPDAPPGTPADPNSYPDPTPTTPSTEPTSGTPVAQGEPLPTGNADANLDKVGSSGTASAGEGGGGGDFSGGGGDFGGGGAGGEYATHATCRAVSCSVAKKACICKHY
jgi:uncharacterized membrane protein YgcG